MPSDCEQPSQCDATAPSSDEFRELLLRRMLHGLREGPALALGFGQWAQQIGMAWLAYDLTGSAVQLGAQSLGLSLDQQLTRTGGLSCRELWG